MKKKSLLFLSLCAWTLQSYIVQANTIVETGSQATQETETNSLSNLSNTTENQQSENTDSSNTVKVLEETKAVTETDSSSKSLPTENVETTSESISNVSQEKTSAIDTNVTAVSDSKSEIVNENTESTEHTENTSISTVSTTELSAETKVEHTASDISSTAVAPSNVDKATSKLVATKVVTSNSEQLNSEAQKSNVIAVENVNAVDGTFNVRVSKVSAPKEIKTVYVPTWSEVGGQDDIIWYAAKRQLDDSYLITVDKKQHKNSVGKFHSHVYLLATDGSLSGIGGTSIVLPEVKASGSVSAVNINSNTGSYEVKVNNIVAPNGLQKIFVPTWTENKGQDDIVWHEAQRQTDGSYLARILKSEHKNESGKYTSHVYLLGKDGVLSGLGTTSAELKNIKVSGSVSAVNINSNTGSYDVKVTNIVAPNGLEKIFVPTWTDSKGQDDIVWHEAQRQSDGSYLANITKTQHKNESGKYTSHVYLLGKDGVLTGLGTASAELKDIKPSGSVSAINIDANSGSFEVKVSNIVAPQGLSKVYVPTWTDNKGQDDIVWHEAQRQTDGNYLVKITKKQHKSESGKYTSHVYYLGNDGSLSAIGSTSVNLPEVKPSGKVSTVNINVNLGSYQVKVSDIVAPLGLDKVFVPTWTENKGQDDIIWHEAKRQSDGTYLTTITKAQHKFESGIYTSHVYYLSTDGNLSAIGATSAVLPEVKESGTLSVSNINTTDGKFDVQVTNVVAPKGIDKVYLPTWTENNGQDDIKWYEAQLQTDGSYKLTIESSRHRYSSGLYHVHAYYRGLDGSMTAVGTTSVELPEGAYTEKATQRSYTVYLDPGHGGADSGASYGGIHEKNLAMSVANKLRENLLQRGINVLMTRTADYDVDFRTERSKMANNSEADLFVSIHFNATGAGVTTTKGIETYWYKYDPAYQPKINKEMHNDATRLAESEILANKVQSSLIKETGAVDRGVRRDTFAVLRETAIPAILVELGFMDNPSELNVIKTDSYHTKLANALTQGIVDWYGAVEGK
ncbi:TPA: GBS Bsp-like repeat-containing protein [Streptococcus suis]|nr:GBS Bsp-like repeat-containing protein [Streptococcus suis]